LYSDYGHVYSFFLLLSYVFFSSTLDVGPTRHVALFLSKATTALRRYIPGLTVASLGHCPTQYLDYNLLFFSSAFFRKFGRLGAYEFDFIFLAACFRPYRIIETDIWSQSRIGLGLGCEFAQTKIRRGSARVEATRWALNDRKCRSRVASMGRGRRAR